jgi:hypothetical protein
MGERIGCTLNFESSTTLRKGLRQSARDRVNCGGEATAFDPRAAALADTPIYRTRRLSDSRHPFPEGTSILRDERALPSRERSKS